MHTTRRMRLMLGTLVVFGAAASFGMGLAVAGTAAADCGLHCRSDCGEGECEEFTSVGCGCAWFCSDGSSGEILCG